MTGATGATGPNPVAELLTRTERPEPVLGAEAVARWPAGALKRFVSLGLLVETDPTPTAVCTACDLDHVEPVQWVREPGLPTRACISCVRGTTWFNLDELRRWVVRLPVLARVVASAVGAAGEAVERVPGRVWKLGSVRFGGRVWAASLAVGLTRPDAAAVVAGAPELRAANALVFVPSAPPTSSVWLPGTAPAVVPLCDLLALDPNGLVADREVLASAVGPAARSVPKGPARVFPTPPGTAWEDVTLVVEDHHITIQVGAAAERFGFAGAGFEDRREKGKPDEVWALLLLLAKCRGVLGAEDSITTKPRALTQKISLLRDRLRALLALDADPFHPNRRGHPYRARSAIRTAGPATFPTPPGVTWDDLTITETAVGVVEVAVAAEARGAEYVRADEKGTGDRGRWEGTTDISERSHRYTLADLGLTEPDLSAALVAVLRAGGRLNRPADDADLLALGGVLARFFRIDEPPLEFDAKKRVWTARFGASSFAPASDR